jgi:hypothetical protein
MARGMRRSIIVLDERWGAGRRIEYDKRWMKAARLRAYALWS